MELNRMITRRSKLERVKVLHNALLPPGANGLLAGLATSKYLNVNHIMLLLPHLVVVIDSTVENQVARPHFFELEIDGQGVELVRLVPPIELESEVFTEIVHDLADEGAAIQVEGCVVMLLALLPVFGTVRHAEVLFGGLDEFFSQTLLVLGVLSVL